MAQQYTSTLAALEKSGELSLLIHKGGLGAAFFTLMRELARLCINTRMTAAEAELGQAGLLVEMADAPAAMEAAHRVAADAGAQPPDLVNEVFAYNLLPANERPALPFLATAMLAEAGVWPLLLATSRMATVIVMDQRRGQVAEHVFTKGFDTPGGMISAQDETASDRPCTERAPIAVSCLEVTPRLALLHAWGRRGVIPTAQRTLESLRLQFRPHFVLGAWLKGDPRFTVCLDLESAAKANSVLASAGFESEPATPVCALRLHGPGFGQRWGLLHLALDGLAQAVVRPLAVSAAMDCITMAVAPHDEAAGMAGLSLHFAPRGAR